MIKVYTDGATIGNPGISGAGIYIVSNEGTFEYSFPLEEMSNHEAEFHAVILALQICKQKFPKEILSFRTDAKVVADIIEKNRTKNKKFQPLLTKISKEISYFPLFFIKWIPQKENKHADQLAKKAIRYHHNQ